MKKAVLGVALLITVGIALEMFGHVNQFCTPGFYKNHPQFITSGSCTVNSNTGATVTSFNQSTLVSALFPDVTSCVGSLTLLQLLQSPTTVCGTGSTIDGGEVILLRQAIARISNAANSSPPSCDAVNGTISHTNAAIDEAVSTDNNGPMISLSQIYDADNNAGSCSLH